MTKVLYICPSTGIGGAETFLKQTFKNANQQSFKNHYLLFRTGPLYDSLREMGATTHLLKRIPRLSSLRDRRMVAKKVIEVINQENIDIVHSTMAYAAIFTARACKQMGTPHVWFQHGPASGWMDRLAGVLPHQGLIVNSHFTAQTQRSLENPARFFVPRKIPIEKILLGTDIVSPSPEEKQSFKEKLLKTHNIPEKALIIGMLCRIQEWKGVHLVVEAARELKKQKLPQDFHFVVWGEAFKNSNYLQKMKEEVQKENLPLSFAGPCQDAALALSVTDIVVNASIQPEPFGLSIIEGMTVGAIPVVPDEGGPVEIVSNGSDGLTFKARQPRSLIRQLTTLLGDSELRSRLSQKATETAANKFTAGRAIGHLEQFYRKVLQ